MLCPLRWVLLQHNTEVGSILQGGFQLGFLGSLSTVSMLMQEVYLLNRAEVKRWRGYVYLYFLTFGPSILIGICAYCIPVWVFGVATNGYNKVRAPPRLRMQSLAWGLVEPGAMKKRSHLLLLWGLMPSCY